MEFRTVPTAHPVVAEQDELVEFSADDMPKPGPGLQQLIDALVKDQLVSPEGFDAGVLKTYARTPRH